MKHLNKRVLASFLVVLVLVGLITQVFATYDKPTFPDVPKTHYAYTYVEKAAQNGWVNGVGDGTFHPDDKVSYAQMCTMLVNAFFSEKLEGRDWPTSPWFARYTMVAHDAKILDGTGVTDHFSAAVVDKSVNRFEMALMLYNTMVATGYLSGTPDLNAAAKSTADWSSIPEKYRPAVAAAKAAGVINGIDSKGTFSGKQSMTRAQAAIVMVKMDEILGGIGSTQKPVTPDPVNPNPVTPDPVTPDPVTPALSGSSKVGTMSDTPVTLSLETHKPINDYWSQQSSEIRSLADKDCFNAAVQSGLDAEMILTQGQFGTGAKRNINLYYNYAMYDVPRMDVSYKDWPVGVKNVTEAVGGIQFYSFSKTPWYITLGNGMFLPVEKPRADELADIFVPIFAKFPNNATDKQKTVICVQSVVDRFDYERGSSGFDWFDGTTGTCESYSRVVSQILGAAGIPNISVGGNTSYGGHAWNQAYLDGQWYIIDATATESGYEEIFSFSRHEQLYGYPHSKNETDQMKVARAIIETVANLKG